MNKFIIAFITLLILSCNSNNQKTKIKNENRKEELESSVVYDTVFFDKSPNNEHLVEKYKFAKSKLNFYKKFINDKKINQLNIIEDKSSKNEIKYLGQINSLNNKNSFHILTSFEIIGIGEMLSPRGKSEIAFINLKTDKIIIYDFIMPEDLPKSIEKNVLFFESDNTKIRISIYDELPSELCIPLIGCN